MLDQHTNALPRVGKERPQCACHCSWAESTMSFLFASLLTLGRIFLQTRRVVMASHMQPLEGGIEGPQILLLNEEKDTSLFLTHFKALLMDGNTRCESAALWSSVLHLSHLNEDVGTSGSCG